MNAETKRRLGDLLGTGVGAGAAVTIGYGGAMVEQRYYSDQVASLPAKDAGALMAKHHGIPFYGAAAAMAHLFWRPLWEPLGLTMLGANGAILWREIAASIKETRAKEAAAK